MSGKGTPLPEHPSCVGHGETIQRQWAEMRTIRESWYAETMALRRELAEAREVAASFSNLAAAYEKSWRAAAKAGFAAERERDELRSQIAECEQDRAALAAVVTALKGSLV